MREPSIPPEPRSPDPPRQAPAAVRPVVELRGVVKEYGGQEALGGVDLTVRPGERVALAGPSGAGKSTLIGLLNATLAPTRGEVRIFGRELARLSPRALRRVQARIGTVYQQFHLVDNLKVIHNVNAGRLGRWSLPRALLSLVRPLGAAEVRRVLERVGIGDKLHDRTENLSGGEQQRVALCRVLLQDPALILADEPIASLDRENSRLVMDLLRDLSVQDGRTAIISLHDIHYALSHCQRVVGLRRGRILFDLPCSRVTPELVDELYRAEDRAPP